VFWVGCCIPGLFHYSFIFCPTSASSSSCLCLVADTTLQVYATSCPFFISAWEYGTAGVDNSLYVCTVLHTVIAGTQTHAPHDQHHFHTTPQLNSATVNAIVSLSFMAQMSIAGSRQTTYGHPNCPSMSVANITDCATQSHSVSLNPNELQLFRQMLRHKNNYVNKNNRWRS
jgi:hypothetical protein